MISRRKLLQGAAITAMAPVSTPMLRASFVSPALAQNAGSAPPAQWRHGVALLGDVKYPEGFKQFDYVNPDAPKGGTARQIAIGSFDNFNLAVNGVKGVVAPAVTLVFEQLFKSSLD